MKKYKTQLLLFIVSIGFGVLLFTNMTFWDSPNPNQLDLLSTSLDRTVQISVIQDFQSIPENYGIMDFEGIALNYDAVAFNRSSNYQVNPPHFFLAGNSARPLPPAYFNIETFQMKPYVKYTLNSSSVGEGVASFAAVVGSSLIGKDMTQTKVNGQTTSRNLVRMLKRNFHYDKGLFGNYPDGAGGLGNSFWYDLLPNIYAMQLLSLYDKSADRGAPNSEPSFSTLTYMAADTASLIT